jgi:hypothetical protein
VERRREPRTLALALDWIEAHCVVPDRFARGDPFRLYEYQLRYLANFYLVRPTAEWVPSNPQLGPAFVHRRGLLIDAQKKGKSPLVAAQVCLEGVGPALFAGWADGGEVYDCRVYGCGCGWTYEYEPGEPMGMPWATPLIQITALSEENTQNVYDALRPMIELGPLAELIPKTGEEFIRLPGGGRIDVVTMSAKSRLGQRVTFVPQDEVGLWNDTNKMTKVAGTQYRGLAGMGGRSSLTTNAFDPSESSLAQREFESNAKDIYRQFDQPPKHLSYQNKRERRQIHRIVYGEVLRENGGHVDLDSIEAESADIAERDPAEAERFFANRLVYGSGAYMDGDRWDDLAVPLPVPDGAAICLGMDGSDTDDWTVIRAETEDGFQFTPVLEDGQPTIWNPVDFDGQVPRLEVRAAVAELFRRYRVARMYVDPPDWKSEIDDWAAEHGEKRVLRWETYRLIQMHAACERLHIDVLKQNTGLWHDGCAVTARHMRHARRSARPGPVKRYVLAKPSRAQKIDACVASVIVHEAASDVTAADLWPKPEVVQKLVVMRR